LPARVRYDGDVRRLIALMALGGCSFATMQTPHGSPPECTETQGAPIADLALTIASPFLIYAAVRANDSPSSDPTDEGFDQLADVMVTTLISAPVMAILGTSSIYGFIKADRCRRAKRDYQQLMAAPPMPGQYVPPPVMPGPYGGPPPQAPLPMVPPGPQPMPPQPMPPQPMPPQQ
jgi:hypothetical protein